MKKFLVKLLIFLLVGEMVIRVFWHPLSMEERYARDDYPWLRENVVLNSTNWRDKEYDPDNIGGNFRVVFLGGSYTFGWYIDDVDKTFPRLLERKLEEKYGDNFDIINSSRHGFSVAEQLARLRNEAIWFHPNLVIKVISLGEFYHRVKIPFNSPGFLSKSYIYRDIIDKPFKNWQTQLGSRDYQNGFSQNSPEFANVTKNLLEMKRVSEENGAKFAILVFPELDSTSISSHYLHENYHEGVRRFAKDNDIVVIDLLESFLGFGDKSNLVINPIDPHPSELAHELVASVIMAQYDFSQELKSFKPIIPKVRRSTVQKVGDKLDGFKYVRRVDKRSLPDSKRVNSQYPPVYFERKNNLDIQSRPPGKSPDRKLVFLEDKIKTVKSYTHQGWPGAIIEYNFEPNGNEIKLEGLYGFPVIGIKQFTAYWRDAEKHSEVADWLQPESVLLNNGELTININPKKNYFLYKVEVVVGVQQVDINPNGEIADITQSQKLETTLSEDSNKVTFATGEMIGSYPTFLSSEGSFPWVYVDGTLKLAESAQIEDKKLTFNFDDKIKRGSKIWAPVFIKSDQESNFIIEYE